MLIEFPLIHSVDIVALNSDAIDSARGIEVNLSQLGEHKPEEITQVTMRNGQQWQIKLPYSQFMLKMRRNV